MSFHVLLDPLKRSTASAGSKVGGGPKDTAPIASSNIPALKSEQPRRCSFKGINQNRDRVLGWIFNKQVDVIFLTVAGDKHAIHCLADLSEVAFKPSDCRIVKEFSTILCNKYKVTDQFSDGMSTPTIF